MLNRYKNKKIFIIDDEPEISEIFSILIQRNLDSEIFVFNSPLLALDAIKLGNQPNLFLVDIKMPKMTGIKFIEKIKEMDIQKPVIFISGHAEKEEAVACLKLGAFHLLDKPVHNDVLFHTVIQALTLEEISLKNSELIYEKELLISLFQKFININEERLSEIENFVLDNSNLIQENRDFVKCFLSKIQESNKVDREISQKYFLISQIINYRSQILNGSHLSESKLDNIKKKKYL
ncbi:response regulator [Silvanigrella aquatica]|uniref:Response regulatory domain-containing protein n=1 Tax=Silvanigrella aquatica TaxID=1915309 RepID=A0A1L4CYW4_9BACT|nr:response regulator [Silvanigrella aquatica]APJ03127.1 hypothetical protein AXG55_04080 [Silvanigrella aquatica]